MIAQGKQVAYLCQLRLYTWQSRYVLYDVAFIESTSCIA